MSAALLAFTEQRRRQGHRVTGRSHLLSHEDRESRCETSSADNGSPRGARQQRQQQAAPHIRREREEGRRKRAHYLAASACCCGRSVAATASPSNSREVVIVLTLRESQQPLFHSCPDHTLRCTPRASPTAIEGGPPVTVHPPLVFRPECLLATASLMVDSKIMMAT